jgi:hypothetical protein
MQQHIGVIFVPYGTVMDTLLTIDYTTIQDCLRENGTFARVQRHLLLPVSCAILAIFHDLLKPRWRIFVEQADLPVIEREEYYPELTLWYERDITGTLYLSTITAHYPRQQFPLQIYLQAHHRAEAQRTSGEVAHTLRQRLIEEVDHLSVIQTNALLPLLLRFIRWYRGKECPL